MSVLVVGSVAYDTVITPAGKREDALGGSATYFSLSGSRFTAISVVAVVGDDFQSEHVDILTSQGVDTSGLESRRGKSFRWSGEYGTEDVSTRQTLDTQLNVFAEFSPKLAPHHRRAPYVFLANIDPELQLEVLSQVEPSPILVALDSMNFWIEGKNSLLREVVKKVDVLFTDEGEIRELSGEVNLVRAAKRVKQMGPSIVIVKRGEHGVLLFKGGEAFAAPAFPLGNVVDPTGAGDAFAGGFMGYLASTGDLSPSGFRRATVLGSVMGSFAVESFSVDRLYAVSNEDIEARFRSFSKLSQFKALTINESLPWRANT